MKLPKPRIVLCVVVGLCGCAMLFVVWQCLIQRPVSETETLDGTQPIPSNGVIPQGFYTLDGHNMMAIPPGYMLLPNGDGSGNGVLVPIDGIMDASMTSFKAYDIFSSTAPTVYDSELLDTQYHDSVEVIQQTSPIDTYVLKNGALIRLPWTGANDELTFYSPGSYKYGAASYVPTYEDSVYLSQRDPKTVVYAR